MLSLDRNRRLPLAPGVPRPAAGALAVAAAMLGVSGPVGAAEFSIEADGTGDYPTIQDAVHAAAAGDTLTLEDGVFTGTGNRDIQFFGKDLVLRSRNGALATTLDSQGAPGDPHRAIRLSHQETSATRIEGLRIVGGFVEGPFPENGGAGILIELGTHPVVTQCIFDGNEAGFQGFGAGLLAWDDCDITLTDCTFQNGVSGWYGGGFTIRKNCDALIERLVVVNNYAVHAGGGASMTRSNVVVNDCYFEGNSVLEVGGAGILFKTVSSPQVNRCIFVNNTAAIGAAVSIGNDPVVTLTDCLFLGNSAVSGGAIDLQGTPPVANIVNCTFAGNTCLSVARDILTGLGATTIIRNSILGSACPGPTSLNNSTGGVIDIDCSLLIGGQSAINSSLGTLIWGASNVDADPLFCAPDSCGAPAPAGDYTLSSTSPAAPGGNPCGRLGAYPVACGPTSVGAQIRATTWGRLKAAYRDPR